MKIGILALQGGYAAHATKLNRLKAKWRYVRTPADMLDIDGLILPGGESTTFLKLAQPAALLPAIKRLAEEGKPLFGTCAGAIILAQEVIAPSQASLQLIDITVSRNAYGRQIASHIRQGEWLPDKANIEMVFIRAPRITQLGKDVEVLATCQDEPVCVRQGHCLVATFHPELTEDQLIHEYFLRLVATTSGNPYRVGMDTF